MIAIYIRITTIEHEFVIGALLFRYKDTLKLVHSGVKSVDGKRNREHSEAYDLAKEWFKLFAFMSDVMPTTTSKHLPS